MDNKNRFKAGLGFGVIMSVVFIIQNLSARSSFTPKEILISVSIGLLAGALTGFLFGWTIGAFANSKMVSKATNIEIGPDETILFETPANHFKGMEGVGGKLYLTNQCLVFKSHKFNVQNHAFSVSLHKIKSAGRYKPIGIINNGLIIETDSSKPEKFVVEQAEKWVRQLEEKIMVNKIR